MPTAIGLMKPALSIPGWVMQELSADELNQIVLHELAHLRRWDDWTNLAQKIVKALFFFHPAVWWIEQKVSLEREMACDDAVIAETESPRAYAECLAHLAEKTLIQRGVALAQAALGRIRQTSLRVAQILDGNRRATGRAWKPAVALVAGFATGLRGGNFDERRGWSRSAMVRRAPMNSSCVCEACDRFADRRMCLQLTPCFMSGGVGPRWLACRRAARNRADAITNIPL